MDNRIPVCFGQPSLRQYLILIIISILLLVVGVLLAITYIQAEQIVGKIDDSFRDYTELNIRERVSLVNSGLALYDSSLNSLLQSAFNPFLEEYQTCQGNLSKIEYQSLRHQIGRIVPGTADLYVINASGIIIRSTVPEVLYLNLSQNPDYQTKIPKILNGSSFVADRVVPSYPTANATELTGELQKFAFMPTPDHRYLLEIGISGLQMAGVRQNFSYSLISDEMDDINPYLDDVRIYDIHKNQYTKNGLRSPERLNPLIRSRLDQVIRSRTDLVAEDPVSHSNVTYLFIDQDSPDAVTDMSVIAEVVYSRSLRKDEIQPIIRFFAGVGFIAIFIGLILTLWASRLITRPVSDIVEDVDLIAQGDLDHRIRSMKVKEFSHLEESINLMIHRIKAAIREIEHRRTEMVIAADIQQSFLPEQIADVPGYDIAARTIPVKEVGGDFYDIIPYHTDNGNDDGYGILVADVSGKGVPAALFMALSRTIVRVTVRDRFPVSDALTDANRFICADARSGMFVSLFYLFISPGKSSFTCVNAGHNPPVYYSAADRSATLFPEGGIVLGIDDSFSFEEQYGSLKPGDLIVLYSDGVTEAVNGATIMYGQERLRMIIRENAESSAEEILEKILDDMHEFTGDTDQFDDITILVLKRTGT